jgi:hypothetical protein
LATMRFARSAYGDEGANQDGVEHEREVENRNGARGAYDGENAHMLMTGVSLSTY